MIDDITLGDMHVIRGHWRVDSWCMSAMVFYIEECLLNSPGVCTSGISHVSSVGRAYDSYPYGRLFDSTTCDHMPECRNRRRDRLKLCCEKSRVGSSPTSGIKGWPSKTCLRVSDFWFTGHLSHPYPRVALRIYPGKKRRITQLVEYVKESRFRFVQQSTCILSTVS